MQQYGAAKNPPWARNPTGQNLPNMQQQMMNQGSMAGIGPGMIQYPQAQGVFQPNMMQQQANMTLGMAQMKQNNVGINPMGQIGQGQMFSQAGVVSYPAPRTLNPNAFSNAPPNNQQPSNSPKQRVFTGTVTASHNNFGFVDEDIFFQRSVCVKGENPMVGDRVLVEATFNSNMPFKWSATRIQVLPTSKSNTGPTRDSIGNSMPSNKTPYNTAPPPKVEAPFACNNTSNAPFSWSAANKNSNPRESSRNITPNKTSYNNSEPSPNDSDSLKNRNRKPISQSGVRDSRRNRRSEEPKRDDNERSRRSDVKDRDREVDDKSKEKEREKERRVRSPSVRSEKRKRRPVPRYSVRVPKIALNIPDANVLEVRRRYVNLYVPSDFFNTQFRWIEAFPPDSPFPLNNPSYFHIIPRDVDCPIIDRNTVLEPSDVDYTFSAKVMLLSMPHIEEVYRKCCNLNSEKELEDRDYIHPTRLISFLVGLRNKNETMAIGGPWSPSLDGPNPATDPNTLIKTAIRTCKALTGIDLSECTQWYRFMELYYRRAESVHRGKLIPARVETVVIYVPDIWSCLPTRSEWDGKLNAFKQLVQPAAVSSTPMDQVEKIAQNPSGKKEPTPYNELDPKTMNIADLRKELEARNICSKGLIKSQLIAKLSKELKKEEALNVGDNKVDVEDETDSANNPEVIAIDDETTEEEDEKAKQEREKALLKVISNLPENPHILVQASKTAKSGKFDSTVMTLSLLLDYRQEDSKEHSFEVSLFAELFNEMLMRDFGFNIYKALYLLPDKTKEEKKDGKETKDGKDDKDEKKDGDRDKKDDRSKREKDDVSADDENSNDRKYGDRRDKKDKIKMVTRDPQLLLSFVYFDTTHCGYIYEKDIEELLFTLGLNLSRSQVKKLVAKVVSRDSFCYRQLTDKPKDEEETPKTADEDVSIINMAELAAGNKILLPVFNYEEESGDLGEAEDSEQPPSKKPKPNNEDNHMISYKGRLFDIEKLLAQLKRSEQARLETETRLTEVKSENSKLQEKLKKEQNSTSTLTHDLSSNKKKLNDVQGQLSKSTMCTKIFLSALKDIDVKVQSVIHTNLYDETKMDNSVSSQMYNPFNEVDIKIICELLEQDSDWDLSDDEENSSAPPRCPERIGPKWNDQDFKKDGILSDNDKSTKSNSNMDIDKKDVIEIDVDKMDIASDDGGDTKTFSEIKNDVIN